MSRRLLAVVLAMAPHTVAAQTPAPPPPAAAAPAAAAASDTQGFSYSAEGRRDPFVSLTRRGNEPTEKPVSGLRGLAALSVDDVSLRGVLVSREQYVGIVQGSDSKTYIVRAGQKLLDGTIRAIDKDSMVIVQRVDDPLALEKQRELRKAIRQDGAK
jgi:Tfp pilus assembly protein PilP